MAFPKVGVEAEVKGYSTFMSQLGKMGSAVGGFGKAAAKLAIGGVAVLGAATVALGAGFIKLASDSAELATIQAAFKGIAESAGTSQEKMLTAMQKGSLGMVTQKDLMATFNEAAQLVGTTFATQLPDAMGYLSKVSAATGQDMGFMIDSLVKGVGRLSPMILDNLGIQVTLADATANAAEEFGVEADELTKTQIQAGMMNVTLAKLAENTANMPEVLGTAAQAQAAFKVALQDTKDQIGLALLPTFTKLMTAVSAFAANILPKLINVFKNNIVPILEKSVIPAISTLIDVVSIVIDNFSALGDFPWEDVLPESMVDIAYKLAEGFDNLRKWLGNLIPAAIQTLSNIWTGTLQPAFSATANFITKKVIPAINTFVGAFRGLIEQVRHYLKWDELLHWGDFDTLAALAPGVADFVQKISSAIINVIKFGQTFKKIIGGIIENIVHLITVGEAIDPSEYISGFFELPKTVQDIVSRVTHILQDLVSFLQTAIPAAIRTVSGFFTNTLQPALVAVGTFITGTVIPAISTLVNWLIINLPIAFQTVSTFITGTIIPAFSNLKTWLSDTIPAAIQTVSDIWADTLQPALETVANFVRDNLKPILAGLAAVIGVVLVAALYSMAAAAVAAATATLTALAPIVIPLVAIGVAVAALYKIWEADWLGIRTTITEAWETTIKPVLETIIEFFKVAIPEAIATLKDWWEETWEDIQDVIETVWDVIEGIIDYYIGNYEALIKAAMQAISGDWEGAWETIKGRVEEVWPIIQGVIQTAIDAIVPILATAWETIKTAASVAWTALSTEIIPTAWNKLTTEVIPTALATIETIITTAWNALKDPIIPDLWEDIKSAISTVWDALKDTVIPTALTAIEGIIKTAWETLKDPVIPLLWEGIKTAISTIWDALTGTIIPTALTLMETILTTAWETLKDPVVPALWEAIKTAISDIWDVLTTEVIPTALTALTTAITDAWETLRDETIPDLWEDIMDAIEDVWDTLIDTTIPNLITELGQVIDTKLLEIEQVFTDTANYMLTIGANIVANLKQGIENAWQGLVDWFKAKLADLAGLFPLFSEPKNAGSPLYGLHKAGEGIIHNIMDGLEAAAPDLMAMVTDISQDLVDAIVDTVTDESTGIPSTMEFMQGFLDFADELGGIGGDFINRWEDQFVDPAQDRIKAIDDELEIVRAAMQRALETGDIAAYTQYQDYQNRLLVEQRTLTDDVAAAQAKILAIEQQRADLEFLQAQLDLLDLISGYGLDPEQILGGLTLGLDANLEDLLDAMAEAMQQIIGVVEGQLGIESPSKEFQRIGEQAMAGMAVGIEQMMGLPVAASTIASQQMIDNSRSVTIQAGGNMISNGMDQAAFESGIRRIVNDALRG